MDALLAALPAERMLLVRQPRFKRAYVAGDPSAWASALASARAFDGSPAARIGHLNDRFLSSPDDVGTYAPGTLARELEYLGKEGRYLPFGGETCADHARNDCAAALAEMAALGVDYLNEDYHGDVIRKWKAQGCFGEIARRLGYRFVLASARLPDSVRPGGLLALEVALANRGFGGLFNLRPVEVVLRKDGKDAAARLPDDPRLWLPGAPCTLRVTLAVPSGLAEGAYALGLHLPDAAPSLRGDSRYAVRFANAGTRDAAAGVNVLSASLQVSRAAPGAAREDIRAFAVVPGGPAALRGDAPGGPTRAVRASAGGSADALGRRLGAGEGPRGRFRRP